MGKAARVAAIVVAALFAIVGVMQAVDGRIGPAAVSGLIAWLLYRYVIARRPAAAA